MVIQSISFTKPNDEWLKNQVENNEYSSKSEVVNDLIRQARKQQAQTNWIKAKLEKAENSGFTNDSKEEIISLYLKIVQIILQVIFIANSFKLI